MIKRALISVYDKTGIAEFAKLLTDKGIEIVSSGGTYKFLKEKGIDVIEVNQVTGFDEIMDGRVKTLHPSIHGGILARRNNQSDMAILKEKNIIPIDIVVVNLYPFFEKYSADISFDEKLEFIDIGGPTMLRSSAKNFKYVTVIVDPGDYEKVLEEMKANQGATTLKTRFLLARKVFATTSSYDTAITRYLDKIDPDTDPYFKE